MILLIILYCLNCTVSASSGLPPPLTSDFIQATGAINQPDTAQINQLCRKAISLHRNDPQQAMAYANQALALSDSLKSLSGKAQAWLTIGRILRNKYKLQQARAAYLKADSLFGILNLKEMMADTKNKIGITYGMEGYYDHALLYFKNSLEIYKELGMQTKMANCQNNIGNVLKYLGEYSLAIESYNEALQNYSAVIDTTGIASSYDNIGIVYDLQGNYKTALEYYFKSLRLREAVGDTMELVNSMCNIGVMYYYLADYEKARQYQQKNLELSVMIKDLRGEGIAYNNLGSISEKQGKTDEAITHYLNAIKIFEHSGERHALTDAHVYLANLLLSQGTHHEAKLHLEKALALGREIQYKQGIANAFLGLGNLAHQMKEHNNAKKYFLQALQLGEEIGMPEIILSAAEHLSDLYKQLGDYKNAYVYHVLYKRMSDSLINRGNIEQLTRLEMQHAFDKQQDSIQLEQAKKDFLQEMKLKREQRKRNLLIAGILVLFVVLLMVYRIYRQKKKANAEKEVLLKEIHHRVKNNLQTITSLLSLQGYDRSQQEIQTAMEESQGRIQSIALIHDTLYQHESLKQIDMQEYLEGLVQSVDDLIRAPEQQITFEVNADRISLDVDTAVPVGLMVNELVTNAYKHAFKGRTGGKVKIGLEKEDPEQYILSVSDDGTGMSEAEFSGENKSLGLKLISILTKQLKGTEEYHTQQGTKIIIRFLEVLKKG